MTGEEISVWLMKHPNVGILILMAFFAVMFLIGWYVPNAPNVGGWM